MDPFHRETESDHEKRDWSDLSPDLVCLIARKISDLFDFVRFRTVCKHWRCATPASDHHPLLPCLFGRNFDHFLLYSLTSGETHKINFPNPQEKEKIINFPEARHWIFTGPIEHQILAATVDSFSFSLINPLTNNEVILPPIKYNCLPDRLTGMVFYPTETWEHVVVNGYVGNRNSTDFRTQYLASYRHSEDKWVTIETEELTGRYPIVYYKGMYYCVVHQTGATEVIHATTGEIMSTVPPPPITSNSYAYCSNYKRYFVESSGDLLLVCKSVRYINTYCSASTLDYYFEIYRLNQENENENENDHDRLTWVKMSSIADRALFLGTSSGGFSIRANDFDRFKGNCIYFSEHALKHVKDSLPVSVSYLLRYDIEDRCWEELPYPFREAVTWIMPSLIQ